MKQSKQKVTMTIQTIRDEVERVIAEKGIGSAQLAKVERVQRDLNVALMLGASAAILGTAAWVLYKSGKNG